MGAGVLLTRRSFPYARPASRYGSGITNDPEAAGTLIVSDDEPLTKPGKITGIAGRKDFTVIALEKP